jgi:hypothetical protein
MCSRSPGTQNCEAHNLTVDRYSAEGKFDHYGDLAREAVSTHPDVIAKTGAPLTLRLKAATSTIPIVTITGDPIRQGIVSSIARPGGNITGVSVDAGFEIWAIQKYMNTMRVPQLFVSTGASRFGDQEHFPWTIGWQPTYRAESRVYASYILENHPTAKIGVLYQNDDFGKDYLQGLKDALGDKYDKMVIVSASYDVGTPTVDSEVVAIKTAKPDVLINIATPKYAAQAIRKVAELDWHPIHIMTNVSSSVGGVLKPAGIRNAVGILTAGYNMDVTDPQWDDYPGMQHFRAFLEKYYPEADKSDGGTLAAYSLSTGLVEVLKRCGDNLTRDDVMKVVANLDFEVETLRPGIRVKTSPTDFYPIEQMRMIRFNGEHWEGFGPIIDAHVEQVALSSK